MGYQWVLSRLGLFYALYNGPISLGFFGVLYFGLGLYCRVYGLEEIGPKETHGSRVKT